jgi:N-6 DNA Methylase
VRSFRSAAALLQAASSLDALTPILSTLGFANPPLPLDPPALSALGTPPTTQARIARGPGALRALAVAVPPNQEIRATVATLASNLTRRSPQLLWLITAVETHGPHLVIAACDPARPPRTTALVVHRDHIVDSDAETLCALEAATSTNTTTNTNTNTDTGADTLTHARRLDILGRDALNRRFYHTLNHTVTTLANTATTPPSTTPVPGPARQEIALLYTCRLLFLAFLEAKGWLNHDRAFLLHSYTDCLATSSNYHTKILRPLFFGTLNTPPHRRAPSALKFGDIPFLNGGLFTPSPLERRHAELHFTDPALGALLADLLARYRFTAREDRASWSEAAIDPEMLGKAFESLMAGDTRHSTGAYYTPQALVAHTTRTALTHTLAGTHASPDEIATLLDGAPPSRRLATALRDQVQALRILDPACGSGAFLVHTLESLAALTNHLGDPRDISTIRRDILTHSIFGVDINPTAVWLCELRLWLSVVIETNQPDPMEVPPLPNLDRNIRVGDSLTPTPTHLPSSTHTTSLAKLRDRYTRATGPRKHTLRLALDHAERRLAIATIDHALALTSAQRADLITAFRTRDLFGDRPTNAANRAKLHDLKRLARTLRLKRRALDHGAALPFAYATHFADAAAAGGFDTVIGNPPWVRLHAIPRLARETLRHTFHVFRHAPWHSGATRAHASTGFASQIDLAALFIERSLTLCRPGGVTALLTPAKLLHSLAGGGLRTLLLQHANLLAVDDWSAAHPTFDAAVYPSLLVARHPTPNTPDCTTPSPQQTPTVSVTIHRPTTTHRWSTPATHLPIDDSPGSPWLLIPPAARDSFLTLANSHPPLADTRFGRPTLGVKCGCNAAFIVTVDHTVDGIAHVRDTTNPPRTGTVEHELLRPLIRGETLTPWCPAPTKESLIWTHSPSGPPLQTLPPHARRWLTHWRDTLTLRRDARPTSRWWSLFRTEAASPRTPRVIWADLARTPRAATLPAGHPAVPLNTCYSIRCPDIVDAYALTTLLNSPLTAAWLNAIAEPARNGFNRYLGWTIALLPTPKDWPRARRLLAPLAEAAAEGEPPPPDLLWTTTLRAYALPTTAVAALVAWTLGPTPP